MSSLDRVFHTEKHLVEILKLNYSAICDWCTVKNPTLVSEEVNLGFGIADLVISKISNSKFDEIILNNTDVALYFAIKDFKGISFDSLYKATQISPSHLKKSINKLIFCKIIKEKSNKFHINKTYKQITKKSIAIEAKLKNWQRALNQAYRYKWFASEVYVIMDRNYVNAAVKSINEFKRLNVGLAGIDVCGEMVIYFKPQEETPINNKMAMMLNERVKEHLLSSQI